MFEKVDALLIKTPDENFFYFTKLEGFYENSYAVVLPDKVITIAPHLEEKADYFYKSKKELEKILKDVAKVDKLGINGEALSYKDFVYLKKLLKTKLIDVSQEIKKLRVVKKPDEINLIKKAYRISNEVVNQLDFRNKTEKEIVKEIEMAILKNNAKLAFEPIVAFGKNSAIPHHMASNKKFVLPALIDLGAKYKGYCADITRTFIDKKGKKVYEIVEEALYMAIDNMVEGIKAKEVYELIEKFFKKHGYKMLHGLGHSIGLKVHDGYALNKKADFILKENMVFAVEPAIYTKSFGVRLEEDIIVGKRKGKIIA